MGAGQRPPGQRTLLPLLLLAHHPVAVLHVLVGRMSPVIRLQVSGVMNVLL